eukprot:364218-Chlamydomonas_euryale.AAC.4
MLLLHSVVDGSCHRYVQVHAGAALQTPQDDNCHAIHCQFTSVNLAQHFLLMTSCVVFRLPTCEWAHSQVGKLNALGAPGPGCPCLCIVIVPCYARPTLSLAQHWCIDDRDCAVGPERCIAAPRHG